jgi:uncharacterized protein (DUF1697 family)
VALYVALLRGINVGRHRRVAMADLRAALTKEGFANVTTHIQSGNVLLETRKRRSDTVGRSIEGALRTALGLDIDVVVRTAGELAEVARNNPFLGRGADPATLYVAFLKSKPTPAGARALANADFGREEFVLRGAEIYLRYPNGLGRAKMTAAFFERALRTPATVRNWNVIDKLVELAAATAVQ